MSALDGRSASARSRRVESRDLVVAFDAPLEPRRPPLPPPVRVDGDRGDGRVALVVVSERQLRELLLGRIRPLALPASDAYTRYCRLKRAFWIAVVGAVAAGAAVAVRVWPLPAAVAAVTPWAYEPQVRWTPAGAGFSVIVAGSAAGSPPATAARLRELGLPAFTAVDRGGPQVLVGPYASLDEAEAVQRRLNRLGFPSSRLHVDESARLRARAVASAGAPGPLGSEAADPALLVIGAPGRVSLVIEFGEQPRNVTARRLSETTLEIDAGPTSGSLPAREFRVPDGLHLLERVSLGPVVGPSGEPRLRAALSVPDVAQSTVRVEDRRVYVDLSWPQAADSAPPPPRPARAAAPVAARAAAAPAGSSAAGPSSDAAALVPLIERFERVAPFLLSAARSPSPDVLAALGQVLVPLDRSIRDTAASGEAEAVRRLLASASASALRAADPIFAGDRLAYAHDAVALVREAAAHPAIARAGQR